MLSWETSIGLHTDHCHISRVTDCSPDSAGDEPGPDLTCKWHAISIRIRPFMPIRVVEYRVWRRRVAEIPEKRAAAPSDWMIRTPMERGPTRGGAGSSKVAGREMEAVELNAKAGRQDCTEGRFGTWDSP
ncbi:hypothetical protein SADUNF_Sadunf17G0041800 [Salix dunnii]|uniref:Uncharacterized protein n=1 Tax=Salix dunnii TaxID=1413687 RepID=A0A835J5C7_9ROSI|nr:hypothetical protein SADUNF_Sadunf17G0041800 [Salix dunnii]